MDNDAGNRKHGRSTRTEWDTSRVDISVESEGERCCQIANDEPVSWVYLDGTTMAVNGKHLSLSYDCG